MCRPQALLLDETSGKVIHTLKGHLDYSFAVAWHPNGLVFATGNQVRDRALPFLQPAQQQLQAVAMANLVPAFALA